MKSITFFVASLCLGLFALALSANAQACGAYYINVSVQDPDGGGINNARVDLMAIEKDESAGKNFVRDAEEPSRFTLQLSEGQDSQYFHKIVVNAPGYNRSETKVKFHSCANRGAVVKLSRTASPTAAVWQFKNTVEVEVSGTRGENVDGLKLTVIDGHGKASAVPAQKWFAFFDLPNGEYTLEIEAPGFQAASEKLDLRPLADVTLKVQLSKQR